MKVSQELLNKLSGQKYEDYQELKKTRNFWWNFYWWITFLLFLITYSTIIFIIFTRVLGETKFCFGTVLAFFTLGILVAIIDGEFDTPYTRIFDFFFHKTNIYSELYDLKTYFESIEKQIEEQSISILREAEKESRVRLSDNKNINYYLRRKRNPALYSYEIEKARKNYELNQKTLLIFDKNIDYIKFDFEKHKYFKKLQLELSYENIHFTGLLAGIGRLYNRTNKSNQNIINNSGEVKKTNSDYQKRQRPAKNRFFGRRNTKISNSIAPLGINDEPTITKTKNNQPTNKITPDEIVGNSTKQKDEIKSSKESKIIELPESSVFKPNQIPTQSELDFENQRNSLKEIKDLPVVNKKRMTDPSIIKASPDFYRELTDRKTEIGAKGELLVMEYERQRLRTEARYGLIQELEHTSKKGDGYGYDIRSIENQEEIYIEVKTTTGNFDGNLFFTRRELQVMDKYKENYYLYRVFNFNEIENTGNLYIFRGRSKIRKYYDFNPTVYKLEPKEPRNKE